MITDQHAAALCSGIYNLPGSVPVEWDNYDAGADDGVTWALKKIDGVWLLVFRGSVTLDDWLCDLQAFSRWSPDLQAHVHPGFNRSIHGVWNDAKAIIGADPWIVTGHSLGAARAANAAAYAIVDGKPPLARIVFGEPKSGFADMCAIVAKATGRSYMNQAADGHGHDLVTDVPFTLTFQPYTRASEVVPLDVTPPPYDGIDHFRFHHIELYLSATPPTLIV
jgi:hypothetical protein